MRKLQIAVVGSTKLDLNVEQDKAAWDFAYRVGFALGRALNIAVLTSSSGGVSEAVTKGVNDAGGISVSLIQGTYKEYGNPDSHVNIATTMKGYEYSWPLIYSSDCVIAIGGGIETGIQISLAVDLGIHVVIYSKAGGISSEVFTSLEPTFQKMRSSQLVYLVDNSEEAFDRAKNFALIRAKKEVKIDDKTSIEIQPIFDVLFNNRCIAIILLLNKKKTLSPQEISDELKIPLIMVQAYLQEMDSFEIVLAKKTIGDEHLFMINPDNSLLSQFINILSLKEEKK
ncbi:MAG: hypothetical protein JXA54_16155 [Candidatus Heimdallarchaeota archaeon]|nr:hypothetical protein [Candidatus Heimdallarchaeota archaeon]